MGVVELQKMVGDGVWWKTISLQGENPQSGFSEDQLRRINKDTE